MTFPYSNKNDIFGILSARAIDWYMYGSNPRRGGGSQGGSKFGGKSPKTSWDTSTEIKYIVGILSSSSVDLHPFKANWVEGGNL